MGWYDPKAAARQLIPEDDYDAVIQACTNSTSKTSGQPMKTLTVRVYANTEYVLYDYLTAAAAFKIKNLASALGVPEEFEAGTFDPCGYVGRNIRVTIKTGKQQDGSSKSEIKKYLPGRQPTTAKSYAPPKPKADVNPENEGDDIVVPF